MSATKSQSKKRKHDSISQDSSAFKLSGPTPGKIGPVLSTPLSPLNNLLCFNLLQVSYPALQAPPSTPFRCYAKKKVKINGAMEGATDIQNVIVVGETESVEFVSNGDETTHVAQGGCR
jgi:DNA-directed RNA polymerase I subunit RPA49